MFFIFLISFCGMCLAPSTESGTNMFPDQATHINHYDACDNQFSFWDGEYICESDQTVNTDDSNSSFEIYEDDCFENFGDCLLSVSKLDDDDTQNDRKLDLSCFLHPIQVNEDPQLPTNNSLPIPHALTSDTGAPKYQVIVPHQDSDDIPTLQLPNLMFRTVKAMNPDIWHNVDVDSIWSMMVTETCGVAYVLAKAKPFAKQELRHSRLGYFYML